MRVILDECLPRKLKHELPGHEVLTVPEAGWAGKNADRLALAVITLRAASNRIEALRPLIGRLRDALGEVSPGQLIRIVA